MRAKALIFLTCLAITIGYGQTPQELNYHSLTEQKTISSYIKGDKPDLLNLLFAVDVKSSNRVISEFEIRFNSTMEGLQKKFKKSKSEELFLSGLFYSIHRKYLKQYSGYSTLHSIFENGTYDCLSATTLYSLVLNELNIDHEIIETDFHIYIKVKGEKGTYLMESTDPLNGFVKNQHEIEERVAGYAQVQQQSKRNYYELTSGINQSVGTFELVGLQYYNEAVKLYNEQDVINSVDLLQKAYLFKKNDLRFENLTLLAAETLQGLDTIDDRIKQTYLKKLAHLASMEITVASR